MCLVQECAQFWQMNLKDTLLLWMHCLFPSDFLWLRGLCKTFILQLSCYRRRTYSKHENVKCDSGRECTRFVHTLIWNVMIQRPNIKAEMKYTLMTGFIIFDIAWHFTAAYEPQNTSYVWILEMHVQFWLEILFRACYDSCTIKYNKRSLILFTSYKCQIFFFKCRPLSTYKLYF